MPGKLVVGIIADFVRQDEGEYTCPTCTVFGLSEEEVRGLVSAGLRMTDHYKEEEGYEVKNSAFKVMRELGKNFGYEPLGDTRISDAPGGRKTVVWTLVKDA